MPEVRRRMSEYNPTNYLTKSLKYLGNKLRKSKIKESPYRKAFMPDNDLELFEASFFNSPMDYKEFIEYKEFTNYSNWMPGMYKVT